MELILRNAIIAGQEAHGPLDIGIADGRIAAIGPRLAAQGRELALEGRLVAPGFIETHIHLDKSRIIERCTPEVGRDVQAVPRVAAVKRDARFTPQDVYERGARTLEQCILHGTTHMRTHVEVDPGVGMRGFEGVLALVEAYRWAIDLELCVFPQEGLTNNPGTEELLVQALRGGARVVGAAPGFDTDHRGQIERVFALAREFDVDIDMHLDSGDTAEDLDVPLVCELTERYGWGGRVAVGHETKLAALQPKRLAEMARRLADAGVAVTVLPATDLFMRGRGVPYNGVRGVTPAHLLVREGVNCSLSTNNVLNPFTPYGDCSLIRMANLYANACQASAEEDLRECFAMLTTRSARLLRLPDYGIAEGKPADLVVLDCADAKAAVAELATPLYGFKRGRQTFTRQPAVLHRP
jgi:cytosine/creatinine deaminase